MIKCRNIWLAGVLVLVGMTVVSAYDGDRNSTSETSEVGSERAFHLKAEKRAAFDPEQEGCVYRFSFDGSSTGGIEAGEMGFAAAKALVFAAGVYALYTGDYIVSLADVVDSGFWPYSIVPDVSADALILSDYRFPTTFSEENLAGIESPDWLLDVKEEILSRFYTEYYFHPPAVFTAATDTGEGDGRVLPGDLVRLDQFWVNPLDEGAFEYGESRGMISDTSLDWLNQADECRLSGEASDYIVVIINAYDLYPAPLSEEAG